MECRRLSVCLSDAWIVTKRKKICLDFYTTRKVILSSFLRRRMVTGDDPFYLKSWVKLIALERNRRFSVDIHSYSASAIAR